jgi:hypothetical protein
MKAAGLRTVGARMRIGPMMHWPEVRKRRAWPLDGNAAVGATILLVGILYVVFLANWAGPIDGLWSIDQGVRLEQIESLRATRFRSLATLYPGESIDPNHEFTPLLGQYLYRNGRSYSMFSVAWAATSSVPFALFSYAGLYVVPVGATLVLLFLAHRLTRENLSTAGRLLLVLVLGLTTPLAFYGLVFWDHTLVAMLVLLALWWVVPEGREDGARRLFLAGLTFGLAAWFRPETMLAFSALPGAMLLARRLPGWKPLLWLATGGAAALIPLFLFNQLAYGFFLGPHVLVAGHVTYIGGGLAAQWRRRTEWAALLLAPRWRGALAAIAALLLLRLAGRWPPLARRRRLLTISSLLLAAAGIGILLRLADGLQASILATAPLALLLLLPTPESCPESVEAPPQRPASDPGARTPGGRGPMSQFLGLFALLYLFLAFLAGIPDGGVQWGPRLLLPAVAPLAIAGFLRLADWTERPIPAAPRAALFAAFLLLSAAGLVSEIRGLRAIHSANEASRGVVEAVIQTGQRTVVCSDTAVASLLAPIFYRGYLVFRAETAGRLEQLVARLARHRLGGFVLIDRPERPVLTAPPGKGIVFVEGSVRVLPLGFRATVFRITAAGSSH